MRFLHTIKLKLNDVSPNMKLQFTSPTGAKLLSVADLTLTFCKRWIFDSCNFLQYSSLIQHLVAPVSIKALHIVVPTLVENVVPCSDPMITSSV